MGAVPHLRQGDGSSKKDEKSLESINSRLQLVVKSGKYMLGYKQTLKMMRQGNAKLDILAYNCPALRKPELELLRHLGHDGYLSLQWKQC